MSLELLQELIGSDDAEVRRLAIGRAASVENDTVLDILVRGLQDSDWRVRKEAVNAFELRGGEPTSVERLISALEPGENVGFRNAAVEALGHCGTLAVKALGLAMPSLDADGRKLAAEALARTAREDALPVLGTLLEDPDLNVRAAAIEAIAGVGSGASSLAADLLERALDQDHSFIQLVTLDAIGRLGLSPSWERLRPILDEPMLRPSALRLATRAGAPETAPLYAAELLRASTLLGPLEPQGGSSPPPGTLLQQWSLAVENFALYAECSESARKASKVALVPLPHAVIDRLLADARGITHDGGGKRRGNALALLAIQGEPRAAKLAVGLLGDESLGAVAQRALQRLGGLALGPLVECYKAPPSEATPACVALLGELARSEPARPQALATLRQFDASWPTPVVRSWLTAVSRANDERALALALPLAADGSRRAVRNAALSSARTYAREFETAARQCASKLKPDAPDAALFAAFLEVLGSPLLATGEDDRKFLMTAATNQSAVVRVAALMALGRFCSEAVAEVIAFAFNDEEAEVRVAALTAMAKMRDEQGKPVGTQRILRLLHTELESALGGAAIRALGESADPAALPELRKLAANELPRIAVPAVEALAQYPAQQVGTTLLLALRHPEPEVIKAALNVLVSSGRLDAASDESGSPATLQSALAKCLNHNAWDVRRLAADLLGRVPSEAAKLCLQQRLAVEQEAPVIEAIRRSVGRVGSSSGRISIAPFGNE